VIFLLNYFTTIGLNDSVRVALQHYSITALQGVMGVMPVMGVMVVMETGRNRF
jgi:hypothetical protein